MRVNVKDLFRRKKNKRRFFAPLLKSLEIKCVLGYCGPSLCQFFEAYHCFSENSCIFMPM